MTTDTVALPAPLTASEIAAVREQKRYQKAKEMRMYALHKQGFSVGELLSVLMLTGGLLFVIFSWASGLRAAPVIIGAVLVAWLEAWRRRIVLEQRFVSFEDLQPDQCQGMLELLQDLPDGQRFRQNVLAQGRCFTEQDLAVVEAAHNVWASHEHQRAAEVSCKTLYDIPA